MLAFSKEEYVYFGCEIVFTLTLISFNYLFVFFGLIDFVRRRVLIHALGAMISPTKSNLSPQYRYIPSIQVLCPRNLANWMQLRISAQEIGKIYLTRIFLNSSIFLGIYLVFGAFILV